MNLTKILTKVYLRRPRLTLGANVGIVTATDERMFVGFQLLYTSIVMRYDCQVVVVDLGMKPSQKEWCKQQSGLITFTPDFTKLKFLGDKGWQKWNKPYFFQLSPFPKTLWLNADTMILSDMDRIFEFTDNDPFLVAGYKEIPENDWCFAELPGKACNRLSLYSCYPETAVIGLNVYQDNDLLTEWLTWMNNIARTGTLNKNLDASLLAWILASYNKLDRLNRNPIWNWSVQNNQSTPNQSLCYDSPFELLVSVKSDFPLAYIIHWRGQAKPWFSWDEECLDIDPHLAVIALE